jgi:hypothetical protein
MRSLGDNMSIGVGKRLGRGVKCRQFEDLGESRPVLGGFSAVRYLDDRAAALLGKGS